MPRRPDFYCYFLLCGLGRAGTRPVPDATECGRARPAVLAEHGRRPGRIASGLGARSSGSRGVSSNRAAPDPVGRRGITGLVRCCVSPFGIDPKGTLIRGSIQKKGKKWYAVVYDGVNPATGELHGADGCRRARARSDARESCWPSLVKRSHRRRDRGEREADARAST